RAGALRGNVPIGCDGHGDRAAVGVVPPRYGPRMAPTVRPRLAADLLGAVFPAACPGCGRPAEPVCARCAATLRAPPAAPPPSAIDAWVAPFAYEGVARELVARAKYRGRHAALSWLADAIVDALGPSPVPVDVVTWVPTDRGRRRARGFDHAGRLAPAVARPSR